MNARSESAKRLSALTDRRRQVATLACQGLSNRQIAEKLGVGEGHRQNSSARGLRETRHSFQNRARENFEIKALIER